MDRAHAKTDHLIWQGVREEFRAAKEMENGGEKPPKGAETGTDPNSAYQYYSNLD